LKQDLDSICLLAREHFEPIMTHLHNSPIPLPREQTLIFKALACDNKLRKRIVDNEIDVINNSSISDKKISKPICIATKSLEVFFGLEEIKEIIPEYYFSFLSTILTRLGTALCKQGSVPEKEKEDKEKKDKRKERKRKR